MAAISFTMGVVATSLFNRSDLADPVLTPRQKELQVIAVEAERRPFFPAPSSSSSTPLIENSQSEKINSASSESGAGFDYIKSNTAVRDFQKRLDLETLKHFESININDKMHSRKKEYILNKVDYFLSSKNTWFKASFSGPEINPVKLTFFMRIYSCAKNGVETNQVGRPTLNNSCYLFSSYSNLNDKWNHYSVMTNFSFAEWLSDVFYIPVNLDEMGEVAKETNTLRAYVPMADEGGVIRFLKYEKNKFEWIEGGELRWSQSSEAEARKFEKRALPHSTNYND